MLSPEEKSPPRWLSFLEVGAGSSTGQAQVQSLIVVNVGAGAERGESPGTSQNSVATLSPSLVAALFFMPISLVTIRAKPLLPPLSPLLRLKSHTEDTVWSQALIC